MYHSVSRPERPDLRPAGYWLSPKEFSAHLGALRTAGAEGMTLEELASPGRSGAELPRSAVIITFDDGYLNNLREALPILVECGFKGVFFVTAGLLGNRHRLAAADLIELRRAGMEVGSHGMTHRLYAGLSRAQLLCELGDSRKLLSDVLGEPVDFFSLPRGYLPPALPDLARESGYRGMCTSRPGRNGLGSDPFRWRRFPVRSGDGPEEVTSLLRGYGLGYASIWMREKMRSLLRVRYRMRRFRPA